MKQIRVPQLYRSTKLSLKDAANADAGRLIRIAMSSEEPALQDISDNPNMPQVVYEILDHSPSSVDMSRLNDMTPFLLNHDQCDQVGALRNVSLDPDKVLRADVLFSRSTRGQDVKNDMEDGVRQGISIGYIVRKYVEEGEIDGIPVYRATDWQIFEASSVSIPADPTVGVNRQLTIRKSGDYTIYNVEVTELTEKELMAKKTKKEVKEELEVRADEEMKSKAEDETSDEVEETKSEDEDEKDSDTSDEKDSDDNSEDDKDDSSDDDKSDDDDDDDEEDDEDEDDKETKTKSLTIAVKERNSEVANIMKLCRDYNISVDKTTNYIENGFDVNQVLSEIKQMGENKNKSLAPSVELERGEMKRFDLELRELSAGAPMKGGFIDSLSNETKKNYSHISWRNDGIALPLNMKFQTRDTTTTNGAGLVFTEPAGTLIDFLYARTPILSTYGVKKYNGLTSNIAVGRTNLSAGASFNAEDLQASASAVGFDQVKFSQHELISVIPVTRQLMNVAQYNVEGAVMQDIIKSMAITIEKQLLNGTGGNGLTGINQYGQGVLSGSLASGRASGSFFLTDATNADAAIRNANADVNDLKWVINPSTWAKLSVTPATPSGSATPYPLFVYDNALKTIAGRDASAVTTNAPSNLGTNTDSSLAILGAWEQAGFADWGAMQLIVDPYTLAAFAAVRFIGTLFCDFQLLHPQAFFTYNQILTNVAF